MDFKLINIISENWLKAIGTTLFHSLWIGMLLSLGTAVIMLVTRKLSSTLRYQLLTGCLCLFIIVMAYVFYQELAKDTFEQNQSLAINQQVANTANSEVIALDLAKVSSPLESLMRFWNSYSSQIVLIWFLIICAKSIHLFLGLNTIFYLKRNQLFNAGRIWEEKLNSLANQLEINQKVSIVQSGIAKVPMVIGHFKPIILIPLGLLNGLTLVEVEAILAHELAHIKRRDYLVNLLQSFIEVVFFFNPAVLWISKLIKTERENCCDDLALTCVLDKKNYIRALLSCQEFQQNSPQFAIAFTGKNGQLVDRVSRMLFNNKSGLNKLEKTILTLSMVLVFIGSAAFNSVQSKQTIPVKKQVNKQQKTVQNKVVKKNNTKSKPHFWQYLTAKQMAQKDSVFTMEQRKYEKAEFLHQQHAKLHDLQAQKYEAAKDQYDRDAKRYRIDSIKYEAEAKKYEINKTKLAPQAPISSSPLKPSITVPLSLKVNLNTNLTKPIEGVTKSITSSKTKTITLTDLDDVNPDDLTNIINVELLKDGIISKTTNLSYKIDKKSLLVNGVKQSSILHQKYKSKYLKKEGSALVYNFEYN